MSSWPARAPPEDRASAQVAVVVVNWNTAELIASLLFSLFRVVGRSQWARIVVVDNASTDGSRPLLQAMADAGLLECVFNAEQRYHGPGLNDGIDHLAKAQLDAAPADLIDYIWVLDSDVIVLRSDVVEKSVAALRSAGAALAGQFQYDAMRQGYAHVSSLLLDPARVWQPGISRFEENGAPGVAMQISLLRRGLSRLDFPFRKEGYLIHLGRGTLRAVYERDDRSNKYFSWAKGHWESHYHQGGARALEMHGRFRDLFSREVPQLTPAALVEACSRPELVRLHPPDSSLQEIR
jgi:glycosyltransferase involved in cell wall biosynthesis